MEIYEPQTGSVGSGYLINDYTVLTARHIVQGALPDDGPLTPPPQRDVEHGLVGLPRSYPRCRIRPLHRGGQVSFNDAVVAWWSSRIDVALLVITDTTGWETVRAGNSGAFGKLPMWADVTGGHPFEVTAVGFPDGDVDGRIRESRQIKGFVTPLSGVKSNRWVVQIEGGARLARPNGGSTWAGMSGAALFADDLLIGIIESDKAPGHPERRELWALPARAFADDPHLTAWVKRWGNTWIRSPADPGDPVRMLRRIVDANQSLPVLDGASTSKIAQALTALQHARDDQMTTRRAVGRTLAMMRSKGVLHDDLDFEMWEVVFRSLRELRTALADAYTELVVTGPESVRAAIDAMLTTIRSYLGRHETSFHHHSTEGTGSWLQVQNSWPGLPRASLELLAVRETLAALIYPLNQYAEKGEVTEPAADGNVWAAASIELTTTQPTYLSPARAYYGFVAGHAASGAPLVSMTVLATALESELRSLRTAALEEIAYRAGQGDIPAARALLDLLGHQDRELRTRAENTLHELPLDAAEDRHVAHLIVVARDPLKGWATSYDVARDQDRNTRVRAAALRLLAPWKAVLDHLSGLDFD
ncbi:S1 family peptidase [Streptomyces longisporoflavus]|uniref:S1 family peptidase n=1 Tax=Streptomyces longisporoflavus TaxID=28044 RepID=UPI00167DE5F4|nr:serine protease [Streptomyces longisporoflavus]